jgi:hypothetical protein
MVSVKTVRTVALVICVAGIAGMIVTSILNHNGAAVTFGLVSAVAVVCAMVAKAVAADTERRLAQPGPADTDASRGADGPEPGPKSEALAEVVEGQVQAVIAAGADEAAVRQLVGEAVRLGRSLTPSRPVGKGSH